MGLSPKPPPMLVDLSASVFNSVKRAVTFIQSAGVTPEVYLRITRVRKHERDPRWL